MNQIRETPGSDDRHPELTLRVAVGKDMDWTKIAARVIDLQLGWDEKGESLAHIQLDLLAQNFRMYGSGTVYGRFQTSWCREDQDFVVNVRYYPTRNVGFAQGLA